MDIRRLGDKSVEVKDRLSTCHSLLQKEMQEVMINVLGK